MAERYFYARGRYGSTARLVDLCMAHQRKRCLGGECDDTGHCERHARTVRVAERLVRMRARRIGR